jgi:hypothetical protein
MADDEKKKSRVRVKIIETEEDSDLNEKSNKEEVDYKKPDEELTPTTSETNENDSPNTEKKEEDEIKENKISSQKQVSLTKKSDKIPFWILFFSFVVGLSLGAGLVGGIFYYRSNVEDVFNKIAPTDVPSSEITTEGNQPSETSSPEAETKIDFEKYSINILNGSGIKGEAGRVQGLLASSGFTKITTGNASTYNFKATEVSLKEGVSDKVFNKIEESLKTYEIEKTDNLSVSSKFDVVITVGSTKK